MSLLISTVLRGSRKRLAPLPELPWTMPGIEPRCSARTTSTYRPLRSVTICCWRYFAVSLSAQVGLERPSQPRPLLPQPIPDTPQLRARVVHDLAGRIDLAADVGDLRLEGGRRGRDGPQHRIAAARPADRGAGGFDRCQELGEREQLPWLERPPFHGQTGQRRRQIVGRAEPDWTLGQEPDGFRCGVERQANRNEARRAAPGARGAPGRRASAQIGRRLPRCDRIRVP